MVLASGGGVLAARSALEDGVAGSLSSVLHHAKADRGDGFCTFNSLVVAAKTLLDEGVAESVLILDLDAHYGGGTAQLIDRDPRIWHEDVSVDTFDHYRGRTKPALWNVEHAGEYLSTVKRAVAQADRIGNFEMALGEPMVCRVHHVPMSCGVDVALPSPPTRHHPQDEQRAQGCALTVLHSC